MNVEAYQRRAGPTVIVACFWFLACAILVEKSAAFQIVPDTAQLRLVALPVPSPVDQASTLPTSQTTYVTGDTFFVELWGQTTAPEGLAQASADVSFDSAVVTAVSVTHTAVFEIITAGSIDNLAGTIDNLSGSHAPVVPPCSDQLGAAPLWARVAIVEMRARAASVTTINLLDSNDLFFVNAVCNSVVSVPATFVGVTVDIRAPQATVGLVVLPSVSPSDLAATLPLSQSGFPVGDSFVLEMWAQTDSLNGLAQVSADVAFDPSLVAAGTITHSALFSLFTAGGINNFTGTINNLSGAHPPVIPSCSDSVGTGPSWARVATVNMTAMAAGSLTIQSADANDLIFVMAVCGSEVPPVTTFGGVAVAVTLCGNGVVEPGEECDDGNLLAGDCCSPTCTFEAVTTLCRGAVDGCDSAEFCDGAGACLPDVFQPAGTACGNPTDTVCDGADTCDGGGTCLANIAPVTKECRPVAGGCDVAEFCDGMGGCPPDGFQPAGTTCGDPASSICDNPDICDGSGMCSPDFAPATVLCRLAVDECDVDEFCDGAGSCPPDVFQTAGTPCGDPANTVCDNPDSCDGQGTCQPNLEAVTTVCRSSAFDCDASEFCDGLGRCPIDQFQAAGTPCGDPSDTVCDNPDLCDATGACLPNPASSTILCRVAASPCDVDEFCDGLGSCPVDAFQPAGTSCGDPSVTVCDGADLCDGAGTCLPNFEPTLTVCRPSTAECDATEFCDGAGGCPADAFEPLGTACGNPLGTACDAPDSCDGAGVCLVNLQPITTVCRPAADTCDVAELCNGLGQCPPDVFALAGTACGDPLDTICDSPDTCDGAGLCQSNFQPLTALCRAATSECDAEEFCDGVGNCPPDGFQVLGTSCGDPTMTVCDSPDTCDGLGACRQNLEPVTTICRATGGVCDLTEFCDGFGVCPPDAKKLSECRPAADACDVAEFCDGITNFCPADTFAATGTPCGSSSDTVCNRADTCDGVGACQTNIAPPSTLCRTATGVCDVDEFCDGLGNCPADQFATAGFPCGDPTISICDRADSCDGLGTCLENPEPSTKVCRSKGGENVQCDVAEFCDGLGKCPVDAFEVAGTPCGDPTVTVCDNADTCDGSGGCATNPKPVTTECRIAAGVCDVADFCDGAGLCSTNAKSTLECRAAVDECDVAEFCDGVGDNCPVDGFALAGAPCGDPAVSVCDAPDSCDGLGVCLANPKPATTLCRAAAGACDVADFCDGAGLCSADVKSTLECRAAVGACDVAEFCDGVGDNCPADGFSLAGASCGDPAASVCDNPDSCDGLGACLTNPEPTTTMCRAANGPCDVTDFCDGTGACPDSFLADGTFCSDSIFCNGDEVCVAGDCVPGTPVCTGACETCHEADGACAWCIFDHNRNSLMDGFDFSFFSGCFGMCFPSDDPCFAANYDADPQGCVGGGDFGALSGCFSLTCGQCAACFGPLPTESMAMTSSSLSPSASVRLVAVERPQVDDLSALLPGSRGAVRQDEMVDLEVWASLIRVDLAGLASVYVDVTYNPSQLVVEEVVSSASFSTFSRGVVDSSIGLVSALGGCAPLGESGLGAKSTWVRVATLRMRATDASTTTITASRSNGPYGVSVFGRFGDLSSQQIEFGAARLRIERRNTAPPKTGMRRRFSR